MAQTEESVRRERTEGEYALVNRLFDCRNDDASLFVTEQSSVSAVRVEAEHGNAWLVNAEVLLEGLVDKAQLAEYLLLGDACGYVFERNVTGHHADLDAAADHKHRHVLDSEGILDILRMSRESESLPGHSLFVDRAGNQHVNFSRLEVLDRPVKTGDSCLCGLGSSLSRLCVCAVRQAVDYVYPLWMCLAGIVDGIGIHLFNLRYGLAIETEYLG